MLCPDGLSVSPRTRTPGKPKREKSGMWEPESLSPVERTLCTLRRGCVQADEKLSPTFSEGITHEEKVVLSLSHSPVAGDQRIRSNTME